MTAKPWEPVESAMAAPDRSTNIKVAIRFRPSFRGDAEKNSNFVVNPKTSEVFDTARGVTYEFDDIFDSTSTNRIVFERSVRSIVDSCVEGFNGTIFAYGQTASGKTYTMQGNIPIEEGITSLSVRDIFRQIKQTPSRQFEVSVTYLEVYNEKLIDLVDATAEYNLVSNSSVQSPSDDGSNCGQQSLNNYRSTVSAFGPQGKDDKSKDVKIVEGTNGIIEIKNAVVVRVQSAEEVANLLRRCEKARHVAGTALNERSSRSHSILSLRIDSRDLVSLNTKVVQPLDNKENIVTSNFGLKHVQQNRQISTPRCDSTTTDGCLSLRVGFLHLVDLAGSEGISRSQTEGVKRLEGSKINQSLLALTRVISQIVQRQQKMEKDESYRFHITYRDSKLTRFLSNSLGGNSKTAIICCCSPDPSDYRESVSTLEFASRAKCIRNKAKVNVFLAAEATLRKQIEAENLKLRKEVFQLRLDLLDMEKRTSVIFDQESHTKETSFLTIQSEMNQHVIHKEDDDTMIRLQRKRHICFGVDVNSITISPTFPSDPNNISLHSKSPKKKQRRTTEIKSIPSESKRLYDFSIIKKCPNLAYVKSKTVEILDETISNISNVPVMLYQTVTDKPVLTMITTPPITLHNVALSSLNDAEFQTTESHLIPSVNKSISFTKQLANALEYTPRLLSNAQESVERVRTGLLINVFVAPEISFFETNLTVPESLLSIDQEIMTDESEQSLELFVHTIESAYNEKKLKWRDVINNLEQKETTMQLGYEKCLEQLKEKEEEHEHIMKTVVTNNSVIIDLKKEIANLTNALNSATITITDLQKSCNTIQSELTDTQQQLNYVQLVHKKEKDNLMKDYENKMDTITSMHTSELETLKKNHFKELDILKLSIDDTKISIEQSVKRRMHDEIFAAKEAAYNIEGVLEEKIKELNDVKKEFQQYQRQSELECSNLQLLADKNAFIIEEKNFLETKLTTLEQLHDKLKLNFDFLQQEKEQAIESQNLLEKRLIESKKKSDIELLNTREQLNRLQIDLEKQQALYEETLGNKENEIRKLLMEDVILKNDLHDKEKEMNKFATQCYTHEKDVLYLEGRITELENQLKQKNEVFHTSRELDLATVKELKLKNEELQQTLQKDNIFKTTLTHNAYAIVSYNDELENQYQQIQRLCNDCLLLGHLNNICQTEDVPNSSLLCDVLINTIDEFFNDVSFEYQSIQLEDSHLLTIYSSRHDISENVDSDNRLLNLCRYDLLQQVNELCGSSTVFMTGSPYQGHTDIPQYLFDQWLYTSILAELCLDCCLSMSSVWITQREMMQHNIEAIKNEFRKEKIMYDETLSNYHQELRREQQNSNKREDDLRKVLKQLMTSGKSIDAADAAIDTSDLFSDKDKEYYHNLVKDIEKKDSNIQQLQKDLLTAESQIEYLHQEQMKQNELFERRVQEANTLVEKYRFGNCSTDTQIAMLNEELERFKEKSLTDKETQHVLTEKIHRLEAEMCTLRLDIDHLKKEKDEILAIGSSTHSTIVRPNRIVARSVMKNSGVSRELKRL